MLLDTAKRIAQAEEQFKSLSAAPHNKGDNYRMGSSSNVAGAVDLATVCLIVWSGASDNLIGAHVSRKALCSPFQGALRPAVVSPRWQRRPT